ncbi:MAG TPA: 50S ribosomal protein L11 methyltransferase [Polyangiaceae bacterium]|nr:50S ribosomal protein L11 methyltransferase [Polyangiaceae bacterium]
MRLVVSTSAKHAPLVSETLFAAGAQGLEERTGPRTELVAYAETRQNLAAIWRRAESALKAMFRGQKLPTAVIEVDETETWRTAWTEHLRPVQLTRRLLLAPTTAPLPPLGRAQQLILYQPALAFGDGDHATTRLAARAIESHYRKAPGGNLLDIGAGTGVLSFVAVQSGARRAVGTDIDVTAIQAAQTNAALNGLAKSTRFVHSSARIAGAFDLAVINIELRPLLQVLAKLPAAARRAPRLLVSGFLKSQLAEVQNGVRAAGFTPRTRAYEGEWSLLSATI